MAERNLEDLAAATLRIALSDRTTRKDSIRLRQRFVDREGIKRPRGREVEWDLLVRDDRLLVFEIKAYAEEEDVEDLADKVTLVKSYYPDLKVQGVLVALGRDPRVAKACARVGVMVVRWGAERVWAREP